MDKAKLMQRLMATFAEELEEHVRALNRDLLALEKNPVGEERAERFKTLFRTAHSLKGAARSVNVDLIEKACHQMEEILTAVRDGRLAFGADLFALLFKTADAIEDAGKRLREQQDLGGAPLAKLLQPLYAATARGGDKTTPTATPSAGTPKPEPLPRGPAKLPVQSHQALVPAVAGIPPSSASLPPSEEPKPLAPIAQSEEIPTLVAHCPEAQPEPVRGESTVRVSAEKLDAFLARSGELLVARRRVQSRTEDLLVLRDFVCHWRAEWRNLEKSLAELLPREEEEGLESSQTSETKTGTKPALEAPQPRKGEATPKMPRQAALVLQRAGNNLRQLEKDLDRLAGVMAGDGRLLEQAGSSLDDEVRRVRMLPFADACQGLDRMVRDLGQATGKEVELVIEGGTVELDRSVLEGLKDPLRHLVRNSVDHGAEPAARRRALGKSPVARITVGAVLRGGQVEVMVADDGRGLDLEALREQARRRKLPEITDERELARLIFLPGLSTARIITDVSGRGVGMDVVKSQVEALHGTVDLTFTPGKGTRFTLAVPLTLTTLRALLIVAGGQTFAFVSTNVQKLVRIEPASLRTVEGREMISLGGAPLAVASLAETLGLPGRLAATAGSKVPALFVAAGEKRMAFLIDEFLAEQEIVIKGLGSRIRRLPHISGGTILASGKIALVLNAANLIRTALNRGPSLRSVSSPTAPTAVDGRKRILIAEDSVTTRTLEKSILEAAGYDVTVGVDGADAWQILQEQGADLLVSDVDMPRMDGFALTETVRGSKRFHDLPVVLVTARETEPDKARGIAVGADAYLVKSAFDQKNLLETIAQLV